MLRTRIIPTLLLRNESLVKTKKFGEFTYIGDPCNTVRIFNELEVDELLFLDITASKEKRVPNYELLRDIASECFMPLAYGGGVTSLEQAKKILSIGFEKISLNSSAICKRELVKEISDQFGSQAVIVSIDVKKNFWGTHCVATNNGTKLSDIPPVEWAKELEKLGAGEILVTSVDREGTWEGFDIELISSISDAVNIPVIAHGGGGSVDDIGEAIVKGNASAVALGSMVVYQKKGMGVLVSFPDKKQLDGII